MNIGLYLLSFAAICYFAEELQIISIALMFIETISILSEYKEV